MVVFGLILGGVLGYLIKEDQAQVFRLAEPTVTVQAATKTKSAAGKQDVKLSKRERQLIKTERKASKLAKQTKKSVWKELKLIIPGFVIFSAVIMLLTDSDGPRYYR